MCKNACFPSTVAFSWEREREKLALFSKKTSHAFHRLGIFQRKALPANRLLALAFSQTEWYNGNVKPPALPHPCAERERENDSKKVEGL